MDEYLKILLEQVRCKKAHPSIEAEIRGHLEDQIEANIACGMSEEEAVKEAVRDMGSPVETGVALDQIHRPAVAGEMIVLMLFISTLSILLHFFIGDANFAVHTMIGFFFMILVYRMDYSFIGQYSKIIGTVMLFLLFCATLGFGSIVVGGSYFLLSFEPLSIKISIYSFMMLYVPVYGGILYQYYGTGWKGFFKGIIWMLVPVFLSLQLPAMHLAVTMLFSLSIVLSVAVYKGWFQIPKLRFIICYWSSLAVTPIIFIMVAFRFPLLAEYQVIRLKSFLGMNEYIYLLRDKLLSFFFHSQWIGGNGREVAETFVDFNSTYMLTYFTSSYGILAGIFICFLMIFVIFKTFNISWNQKNQLGTVMGCGCGSVFLINGLTNILQNFGLFPVSGTFFPFFSYGGSSIIVSYVLMGLILSVYRYKNVFPIYFVKKKKIFS